MPPCNEVDPSLILDGPWKYKLPAHITTEDNVLADKIHTKRLWTNGHQSPLIEEVEDKDIHLGM